MMPPALPRGVTLDRTRPTALTWVPASEDDDNVPDFHRAIGLTLYPLGRGECDVCGRWARVWDNGRGEVPTCEQCIGAFTGPGLGWWTVP